MFDFNAEARGAECAEVICFRCWESWSLGDVCFRGLRPSGLQVPVERLVLHFEIATIRTRIDWLFAQVLVVPFKVTVEVVEVELRPLLLVDVKGRVLQPHAHGFMRPPAVEDLCREDASNVPEDRIRL